MDIVPSSLRGWAALAGVALLLSGCGRSLPVTPATPRDDVERGVCARFIDALPDQTAAGRARPVTPDSASTAAWGNPPVTLRCGGPPITVEPTAQLAVVAGQPWLPLPGADETEFALVGRDVTVLVTVPGGTDTPAAILGDLAGAVATLPIATS